MTAYGVQSNPAQAMYVDLVGADGIIAASAIIAGPLWAANQTQINADAESHGLTLNSYVAGPGDAGKQPFATYAQTHAWIVTTAQYAQAQGQAGQSRAGQASSAAVACPTTQCLPSGDAALAFARAPSLPNFGRVVGTFAMRGALVGVGLYIAGARGPQLVRYTVAATTAIEAFVLAWAAVNR